MEKEIIEKAFVPKEMADETPEVKTAENPEVKTVETSEAEIADTPTPAEKKQTTRRKKTTKAEVEVEVEVEVEAEAEVEAAAADKDTSKKEASPEVKKETFPPRLKASLRHGFQLKGRYYSRAELGRKNVLVALWKKYPGLFEK